jgi:hypothetical protein
MMLLTQPFLLYLAVRSSAPSPPDSSKLTKAKKGWFEKLGDICLDASRNAMTVLRTMDADGSLSSLVTFDCVCTLKIIMILSLELARSDKEELKREIEFCVKVLGNMEQVGFCKSVVQELPMRLKQMGIKKEKEDDEQGGVVQLWQGFEGYASLLSSHSLKSLIWFGKLADKSTEILIQISELETCKVCRI